jgi:ATP-dependent protease ClpP protease subunit
MSSAFLIFASGTQGERYIAANTGIMCHQFSETTEGKYHDIKAAVKETESLNTRMLGVLKAATGLVPSKIKAKLLPASDVYLSAQEAVDLGIADHII